MDFASAGNAGRGATWLPFHTFFGAPKLLTLLLCGAAAPAADSRRESKT